MAQTPIREFDAKKMFSQYTGKKYDGILVRKGEDFAALDIRESTSYVIKPDQLFGKRGKYGLVGVDLKRSTLQEWWQSHDNKEVRIEKSVGILDTFLIEPFVHHREEYYLAIRTEREYDEIFFSPSG